MARVEVALRVVRDDHGGCSCGCAGSSSSSAASVLSPEGEAGSSKVVGAPGSSATVRPVHVLIVEDNEMQRHVLEKLFDTATKQHADMGSPIAFRITLAKNAAEALQIATVRRDINLVGAACCCNPSVLREKYQTFPSCHVVTRLSPLESQVLLDIIMPDQNGDVMLPRLRHVVGSRTAVVAISAANKVASPRRVLQTTMSAQPSESAEPACLLARAPRMQLTMK